MKKGTISILSVLTGVVFGGGIAGKFIGDKEKEAQGMSKKHLSLFLMMNQWVRIKQEGKNLSSYFEKNGYKNIAVYGMSYAGETLIEELKDSATKVVYGIDRYAESLYADVDIVSPEDEIKEVDAIVVTAITFFDEIKELLTKKVSCPIISLENVLYEVD